MNRNQKMYYTILTIVFIAVTMVLGSISFMKLVKFYVNEEVDYNEWTADLGIKFETDIATCFWEKVQFVNLNGGIRRLLGQREMNGVIKLNNGYLFQATSHTSDETLQRYADRVAELNDYLQGRGIALLYAATPLTSSKYDPEVPEGYDDYGNDNIDRFLEMLQSDGVDTMDFRELMHEDGIDQYDMMYKTDHHWNTKAGFYAYGKIEEYLKEKLNCEVDERVGNIENYTVTVYKEWHLGSRGQRTGALFAGVDDFELITPDFETTIQHDNKIGTLEELILNMEPLQDKEYTSRYTYDTVLGKSLGDYVNLDCVNDKKVLIVTDSYGKAVNPFLIMGFGEVRYIYNGRSYMLTREYIEDYEPDVVILLYYSTLLSEGSGGFNFEL